MLFCRLRCGVRSTMYYSVVKDFRLWGWLGVFGGNGMRLQS